MQHGTATNSFATYLETLHKPPHNVRLRLLSLVAERPRTLAELVAKSGIAQDELTTGLDEMRRAGLVEVRSGGEQAEDTVEITTSGAGALSVAANSS